MAQTAATREAAIAASTSGELPGIKGEAEVKALPRSSVLRSPKADLREESDCSLVRVARGELGPELGGEVAFGAGVCLVNFITKRRAPLVGTGSGGVGDPDARGEFP